MANRWLTVQDVYDPIQTEREVEALNAAKLQNRLDMMKVRAMYQAQKRQNAWANTANDPRGVFNPIAGNFMPRPGNSAGPGQSAAPMPPTMPTQAPAPTPTPPPTQSLTEEDRAALRGVKKYESITKAIQPMVQQAQNDPIARANVQKMTDTIQNDPDYKAMTSRLGYDEMIYSMDQKTGEGVYTLTKNWSKDELLKYAESAPNGQQLLTLAQHPGKYRIRFNEDGAVIGTEFVKDDYTKYSKQELINLAATGTPEQQKAAEAALSRTAKFEKTEAGNRTAAMLDTGVGLTSAAIDLEAERVLAGEPMRSYGYGKTGAATRWAIMNRVQSLAQERGMNAPDIIAKSSELAGQKGGLKDLIKRETLINTYVKRIDATSDLVMDMAKKIGNKDSRLLNMPRNKLASILGSGNYRAFELALYSLSAEIGKVETGQLGISAVTDSQLRIMNAIHDPNLSIAELQNLINGGKALGKTSMDSIREQHRELKGEISGRTAPEPAAPSSGRFKIISVE